MGTASSRTAPSQVPEDSRSAEIGDDAHPRTRWLSPTTLVVCLLTVLSGVLGLWDLADKSFWLDEAWAVLIADGNWSEMWGEVTQGHAYQGLYYVLLNLWIGLFGESEFAVRSLSVLFGAATVPVLYLLGKSLVGRTASLAACLLFALSAYFIRYQQEVRGYTLLLFLLTLSTYMMVKALRDESRWPWLVYALASVMAVYTHLFSLWVFLVHFIVLLIAGARLKRVVATYGLVALGSSFMLRWLMTREQVTSPSWIPRPSLSYLAGELKSLVFNERVTALVFAVVLAAAVGMSIIHIARSGRSGWPLLLILLWATLPVAGMYLGSYLHPMLTARYLIVVLPGVALLAGWCVAQLQPVLLRVLVLLAIVASTVPAIASWYSSPGDDWRGAVRYVLQHARPGDGVFAIRSQPWIHYSDELSDEGVVPEPIKPHEMTDANFANYDRIWLLLRKRGGSDAKSRIDSSDMVRERFRRRPPKGWLYQWPVDSSRGLDD